MMTRTKGVGSFSKERDPSLKGLLGDNRITEQRYVSR